MLSTHPPFLVLFPAGTSPVTEEWRFTENWDEQLAKLESGIESKNVATMFKDTKAWDHEGMLQQMEQRSPKKADRENAGTDGEAGTEASSSLNRSPSVSSFGTPPVKKRRTARC